MRHEQDTRRAKASENLFDGLAAVFSIIGAALIILSTSDGGGIATTPDSINYIAASKSLLSGEGLLRYTNTPFASWGPFYPTFLSALQLVSRVFPIDFLETVRFSHALIFGGIIWLSSRLFIRYFDSRALALIATVWVACSYPLLRVTVLVWSEPLFSLITLALVLYWPRIFQPDSRLRHVVLLGLMATLAPLQRFAGYSITPLVMLSIALFQHATSWVRRIGMMLAFGVTSIPILLWLLYGQSLSAPARRPQENPLAALENNIRLTPGVLADWFLPPELRSRFAGFMVMGLLLCVAVWVIYRYYRFYHGTRQWPSLMTQPVLVALYVPGYLAGLYVALMITFNSPVDNRHMSVLYVFFVFLAFYGLDLVAQRLRREMWIVGAALLWTTFPMVTVYHDVVFLKDGCCRGDLFRQVDLIQWLNENPLPQGRSFSNTPLPLLYTDLLALASPENVAGWSDVLARYPEETIYLIWFDHPDPAGRYFGFDRFYYPLTFTPEDLNALAEVDLVAALEHGQVYALRQSDS